MASVSLLPLPLVSIPRSLLSPNPKRTPLVVSSVGGRNDEARPLPLLSRRLGLSAAVGFLGLAPSVPSLAAILEADDDIELLERVKKDKRKRIERQELISSSAKETGFLQDLVYKLDKVGQSIENNDFPTASLILGSSVDTEWVQNVNAAFTKLTSSPEERTEVDTFNSSLSSLISSVDMKDMESSKLAFVSSANALEKWVVSTGLIGQLKGI